MSKLTQAAINLLIAPALAVAVQFASAENLAPDVLVQSISQEVFAAMRSEKDLRPVDRKTASDLVVAKILPHFNLQRMTRTAMAANWRRASPQQQTQLTAEFGALLVHTYSWALLSYRDQSMQFKPLRAQAGDTEVTVRSEIRQPGTAPISIDYMMKKTTSGWKAYDVKIDGISLTSTYRDSFDNEVRTRGIDGLIQLLSGKNRQNDTSRSSNAGQGAIAS